MIYIRIKAIIHELDTSVFDFVYLTLKDQAMLDEMSLQELYGKLISWVPAAIKAVIAGFIGLVVWITKRQIKRIDGHDVKIDKCKGDISSLREADKMLDMQLSQQRSDFKGDIGRVEEDVEDSNNRMRLMKEDTDRRIEEYKAYTKESLEQNSKHMQTIAALLAAALKKE